jgi:hypothetical protein
MTRAFRPAALALAFVVSACSGSDAAPVGLTYATTTALYTAGTAITPNRPSVGGGAVSAYSVWPALPAGLIISRTSGVISGTPTVATPAAPYTVTGANSGGSASVVLSIAVAQPDAPVIVTQPATQVVALDAVVTFRVEATGAGPLTYRWQLGGVDIAGATGTSYTTAPVTAAADNSAYRVVVEDGWGGSTTSAIAKLRLEGFAPTGPLMAARQSHTATRLGNGLVLVTGGDGLSAAPLTSAELYDPAAGSFGDTGPMLAARQSHTAELLPGGKVLLIGGQGGPGGGTVLDTTELYDPTSETFAISGLMTTPRLFHTSTVLTSGKVLVTGGLFQSTGGAPPRASAELFDPATGTFTATGAMHQARYWHAATLLTDGQVLITGGYGLTGVALDTAELFDPANGTFTPIGLMTTARYGHTATLLGDRTVLVAGGYGAGALASAELFDPVGITFQTTGPLHVARYSHTATLLPSGRVLLAGGTSATAPLSSAEQYDPVLGTFALAQPMAVARYFHTSTLLDTGEALVLGGWSIGDQGLVDAELFAGAP